MKKLGKILLLLCIYVSGLLFLFNNTSNVYAASKYSDNLTIHQQTKIYSKNNNDGYHGCEDYSNYVNQAPEITILTHGLGSKGSYWSNSLSVGNGDKLAYNSNSLIEKMYDHLKGNMTLYYVKFNDDGQFEMYKLSRTNFAEDKLTARIDDVSKHIVIIYESSDDNRSNSNQNVYEEFEYMVDTISMQYKSLTGVLPRLNLIGHSRGGITNIMYATEHPYNVSSIFSLGTPYNGSILGGINYVIEMLKYSDPNTGEMVPGVKDLLDYHEAVKIRDAWNDAYKADVNINVVALGSMTSIDYIQSMIFDAASQDNEYTPIVLKYLRYIQTALNVMKRQPDIIGTSLDFVGGLAQVADCFGINIYNALGIIESDLVGDITIEEGKKILSLYNVINGQVVLTDDLFIDLDSQLGLGFKDDVDFNGFKRYVKIFNPEDLTQNRCIPSLPAVVHNLETMNETYTNTIASSLVYGTHSQNVISISNDYETLTSIEGEKSFVFNSDSTGEREIIAPGTQIKLYEYNNNNCLELLQTSRDKLTYNYKGNKKYLITLYYDLNYNINVSFNLKEVIELGDNIIDISGKDSRTFKLVVPKSGYYMISSSTSAVIVNDVTNYSTNKYYSYFIADKIKYINLTNNKTYNVTTQISIIEPQEISLQDKEFQVDDSKKVVEFINTYSIAIQYKLKISWDSFVSQSATIYSSNNGNIASVILESKNSTYSFTLNAGARCYIIFSNTANTICADLSVNPIQLRWKIDGQNSSIDVILPRGKSYNLQLVLVSNGREIDFYSGWNYKQRNDYFELSNNSLKITETALIGFDINIMPINAPDYGLTVKIGFDNKFDFSISNNDKIILNWNITLHNEALQKIEYVIGDVSYYISIAGNYYKGSLDITNKIPRKLGTTTIKILSLTISGIKFENNTNLLNKNSITVDNLFGGGKGNFSSQYTISCYRHLDNIRLSNSSCYIFVNNIYLYGKGEWTPISEFNGYLDGDNMSIYGIKIAANQSGGNFGFIASNYGSIERLNFYNSDITTTLVNCYISMFIGFVSGNNEGTIDSCIVENSRITICLFKSLVGVIAGYNSLNGTISNCYIAEIIMNVSGIAGGIVGENRGLVMGNNVDWININYIYKDDNGYIGGMIGLNYGDVKNSVSNTYIYWKNLDKNNKILPCIGYLIGRNIGSYSNSRVSGECDLEYQYSKNIFGSYDQSKRCFKVDNGNVGYNG